MLDRRTFLVSAGATALLAGLGFRSSSFAASILKFQGGQSFSFDALIHRAQDMAHQDYVTPPAPPKEILDKIDYDARGRIRFDTDSALFANGPGVYPITFFPLGGLYPYRCGFLSLRKVKPIRSLAR